MKRALLRIWSLWFYFLFLAYFIFAFPLYFILLKIKKRWTYDMAHRLNSLWGYCITLPAGVWIQSINHHLLDKKQTYVYAPNHNSYLDIPVCNVGIRRQFRFMGKAELVDFPMFGWMFNRLHISVKRESKIGSYRAFIHAREKLKEGISMLVYAEGGIPKGKKSTDLARFKDGAFRLAIENKVPLVPVTIIGSELRLPDDGKLLLRPGLVRIRFDEPIDTSEMTIEDLPALKQRTYDIILANLKHYHGADEKEKA